MTSFELTNFGSSSVGTTVNSLIYQIKKNYQVSLKFLLDFVHFLNQYLAINSTLCCLLFFS